MQQLRGGRLRFLDWRTTARVDLEEVVEVVSLDGESDLFRGLRYVEWRRVLRRHVWRTVHRARAWSLPRLFAASKSRFLIQGTPFAAAPTNDDVRTARLVYIDTYCQHPSWFEPVLDVVTERIWARLSPKVGHLVGHEATVISVRGGDYLWLGWDLAPSYYEGALAKIGPITGPVWITSDDPAAANRLIPLLAAHGIRVDPLPDVGLSDVARDFALLCVARTIIMSNSTFCWWATVTGQLQAGHRPLTVVAPDRWIPYHPESGDLLRPDWVRVDAEFGCETVTSTISSTPEPH